LPSLETVLSHRGCKIIIGGQWSSRNGHSSKIQVTSQLRPGRECSREAALNKYLPAKNRRVGEREERASLNQRQFVEETFSLTLRAWGAYGAPGSFQTCGKDAKSGIVQTRRKASVTAGQGRRRGRGTGVFWAARFGRRGRRSCLRRLVEASDKSLVVSFVLLTAAHGRLVVNRQVGQEHNGRRNGEHASIQRCNWPCDVGLPRLRPPSRMLLWYATVRIRGTSPTGL